MLLIKITVQQVIIQVWLYYILLYNHIIVLFQEVSDWQDTGKSMSISATITFDWLHSDQCSLKICEVEMQCLIFHSLFFVLSNNLPFPLKQTSPKDLISLGGV